MASYVRSVAAATAVVGYNLLSQAEEKQSSRRRTLVGAGLAGSAAAGDTECEVKAGARTVANLFNLATGFPTRDHVMRVGEVIEANEELQVLVKDAPATNAINLILDFA